MSIDLPDPNSLPRIRREDVNIQAIVAEIVGDDEPDEQEIPWDSIRGVRYDLVYSLQGVPGSTWTFDSTHIGTGGRMWVIKTINKNEPKRIWQIVTWIGDGSEPIVKAYVGWDGASVQLEWNFLGAPVSGNHKFRVMRNGQLLSTLPATALSYTDTTVASGQRYTYEIKYFAN